MQYVYILKSLIKKEKYYVGITCNLPRRLSEHNTQPSCSHTKRFGPWEISNYVSFQDEHKARKFEKYLKSPSGRAFVHKHLL